MVLLDSLYINNGGGKVLLDFLVKKIEEKKISCYYLFDERCSEDYKFIPKTRKKYLKASLSNRHYFYYKNKNTFSKVVCFGNIPPIIKLKVPVYTYFHQLLFLKIPPSLSLKEKIKTVIKIRFLYFLRKNTDFWIVQSEVVKKKLKIKYNLNPSFVKVIPFYPPLKNNEFKDYRKKNSFLYVSNGTMHKNHLNLIEGFCKYNDSCKSAELHLTISKEFKNINTLIKDKIKQGYNIINHGFVKRKDLINIYQSNEFIIYPSFTESFGLGLIEGMENGCKVIGANLPYTFAVCKPSIIFDPFSISGIKKAFISSQQKNIKNTKQLIFNQIDDLIKIFH